MPHDWSPEERKAAGERLKLARAAKRAAQAIAINPIATDVLPPTVVKRTRKLPPAPSIPTSPIANIDFSVSALIRDLETIPLESVSYLECGTLLNALSASSTAVALARRQKQEQLEAGTHRALCKTCGRMIDISKAGGFQILTERDEHHMPQNTYYCSQNCLLARNMPSHARQTSKEKKENRA